MDNYEHTFIIKHDASEKQQKDLVSKYEGIITNNSGKLIKIENWGSVNFSYPIKKNKRGFYVHIKFEGNGEIIKELENTERIDAQLIRFLTVKVKEFDLETNYFDKKDN